jgi:hypothetical protein
VGDGVADFDRPLGFRLARRSDVDVLVAEVVELLCAPLTTADGDVGAVALRSYLRVWVRRSMRR